MVDAGRADGVDPLEWRDGTDEHRRRSAGGLGHDVQAGVHPVDKVHVGDARRPEHDPVAGRATKAGVGGEIGLTDVRLDLDDPADSWRPARLLADEKDAEQIVGRILGRSLEDRAVEDRTVDDRAVGGRQPAGLRRRSGRRTGGGRRRPR